MKKEFGSEPVINGKCVKTKLKCYNGKINTNFIDDMVPEEGSHYICLSVILIDSAFRTGKNYYRQVFLEGCKYIVTEKRCLNILLMTWKFLLMKKTLVNKLMSFLRKQFLIMPF